MTKSGEQYEVRDGKGGCDKFDHLVMATHTDVTLKILGEHVSAGQRAVLEGVPVHKHTHTHTHKHTHIPEIQAFVA